MAQPLPSSPAGGGKYYADLFALGRMALAEEGVDAVFGGGACTYCDASRFYSHRRDRITGRHAALIWIESGATDRATAQQTWNALFDRARRLVENRKT